MASSPHAPNSRISGRVAIVTGDPERYSETFIRRHVQFLNNGSNVVVALNGCKTKNNSIDFSNSQPILYCERFSSVNRLNFKKMRSFNRYLIRRRQDIRLSNFLNFIEANNVTHILVEFGYWATEMADALISCRRPVYCMFRGNDASARLSSERYVRELGRIFPHFAGVAAVSQFLLSNLAAHGLRHPRAIVLPSGVDTEWFFPGTPRPGVCLCVGRLVPKKSPLPLIEAFARVAHRHDLYLEIVGEGPEGRNAEALSRALGVETRVKFFGQLPHHEVHERMRSAMIYIQNFQTASSGDTEGMPNVLQEAMSCGLPIVTTDHAGISEHVQHDTTGLLVPPGDADALAAALDQMACSQSLREKIGQGGRKYAVSRLDYRVLYRRLETFMGINTRNG